MIDRAHFEKFGEDREARRTRILEERADQKGNGDLSNKIDWDVYDSPATHRKT